MVTPALLLFLTCTVQAPSQDVRAIHPALIDTSESLRNAFDLGRAQANDVNRFYDGIEKTRRRVHETVVSALWLPRQIAYLSGFVARARGMTEEDIARAKAELNAEGLVNPKVLRFDVTLEILPQFAPFTNRVRLKADPANLENIQGVLEVGKRRCDPVAQPGPPPAEFPESWPEGIDLIPSIGPPFQDTVAADWIHAKFGSPLGSSPPPAAFVQGKGSHPFTGQSYGWYAAIFTLQFELYEPDGTPRVTRQDKDITLVLHNGNSEHRLRYRLSDLEKLFTR